MEKSVGFRESKELQLASVLLADRLAGIGCKPLPLASVPLMWVAPGADLLDFAVNGRPGASPVTGGRDTAARRLHGRADW